MFKDSLRVLNHYFFTVCVYLHTPYIGTSGDEEETKLSGFFTNFGVTAANEWSARSFVDVAIEEGHIEWQESTCKEIDLESFDSDIAKHCKNPSQEGIWFKGSKFLFPG